MKRYQEIFTGTDRRVLEKSGFGGRQVFGARPALLVIDVTRSFVGSKPLPVLESIKEYGTSCGEAGWAAMEHIRTLLAACRSKNIPVIYTTADPVMKQFVPGATKRAAVSPGKVDWKAEDILDIVAPLPTEMVLRKPKASAFFATPLLLRLKYLQIDTLIVTGTTTSGCIRATVVDGFSNGFKCFVVEECTFDRFELSHLVNLFDMDAKYADVITVKEALEHIAATAR